MTVTVLVTSAIFMVLELVCTENKKYQILTRSFILCIIFILHFEEIKGVILHSQLLKVTRK